MGRGGSKHLKSALLSQQSRFKAKEKISHAAQVQSQKALRNTKQSAVGSRSSSGATTKSKGNVKGKGIQNQGPPNRRPTVPFRATDRILLIGEGNFSYARSLVVDQPEQLAHLPPGNITATAYDTEEECYEKYADAEGIVALLREKGVNVLFRVDATKLHKCAALKGKEWDKIVWNFPHAGKGITDQDRNILINQLLLLDFLAAASKILYKGPAPSIVSGKRKKIANDDDDEIEEDSDDDMDLDCADLTHDRPKTRGTVLITLRNVVPYTSWNIPKLAKSPPLPPSRSAPLYPIYVVLRSFQFHRPFWKGYEHRMTKGDRAHGTGKTGEGGEDRTWEFYLSDYYDSTK